MLWIFLLSLNISKIASELYLSSYTTLSSPCVAGCLQCFHSILFTQDTINRLVPTSTQMRLWRLIFASALWEIFYHCILAVLHCWWIEKPTHSAPSLLMKVRRTGFVFSFSHHQGGITVDCSGREVERKWRSLSAQNSGNSFSKGRAAPCRTGQGFHAALPCVAPSEAGAELKLRVMRLGLFSFLCTALRATAWNSRDSLEGGWACKGGAWGLIPGFRHALAHLLRRSARRALQGTMRRIRLNETLGSLTGGENQGCRDNQLWLSQQYLLQARRSAPASLERLFLGDLWRFTLPTYYLTAPLNIAAGSWSSGWPKHGLLSMKWSFSLMQLDNDWFQCPEEFGPWLPINWLTWIRRQLNSYKIWLIHSVTFPSPLEMLLEISIASYSKINIIVKCTKFFFFRGSEKSELWAF